MQDFSSGAPIYQQLLDKFLIAIVQGKWEAGGKIPSVRQLALHFGVNPNTVQKSLQELEATGLARSERTTGRFVTDDPGKIEDLRKQLALRETRKFTETMAALGLSPPETSRLIEENWPEENVRIPVEKIDPAQRTSASDKASLLREPGQVGQGSPVDKAGNQAEAENKEGERK